MELQKMQTCLTWIKKYDRKIKHVKSQLENEMSKPITKRFLFTSKSEYGLTIRNLEMKQFICRVKFNELLSKIEPFKY